MRIVKDIRESKRGRKSRRLYSNDTWIPGCSNPAEYRILDLFTRHKTLTYAQIRMLLPKTIKNHRITTALSSLKGMRCIARKDARWGRIEYILVNRPTVKDMNQWLEDNGYPERVRL